MIYFYTYRDQSALFSQALEQNFAGFDNPTAEIRSILSPEERSKMMEYTSDVDEPAIDIWSIQDGNTGAEFEFVASLQGRCRELQVAMEVIYYDSAY